MMDPEMSTPQTTDEPDAVQQAYLAEASGDLVAMSFPGARKVAGWLFWVVFPLFALVSLVFVVLAFVSHVGHQPDGIKGTFVANRLCSRGICVVGGVFTSEDGTIKNESLLGDSRWKTDEMHQVVWNPHGVEVSALGTWDATVTVLGGVAAVSYLAAVGWFAQGMRRGRRH
jgi:hypothetical protein